VKKQISYVITLASYIGFSSLGLISAQILSDTGVKTPTPHAASKNSNEYFNSVIELFRKTKSIKQDSRILLYINRELVDGKTGILLQEKSELVTSGVVQIDAKAIENLKVAGSATTNSGGTSTPSSIIGNLNAGGSQSNSIALTNQGVIQINKFKIGQQEEKSVDRKSFERDIERYFSKELRRAGLRLVDQGVAAQLILDDASKTLGSAQTNPIADRERQVINQLADIVIELLVTAQRFEDREVSGALRVIEVPEIRVKAIDLKTSQIVGQASSSDIFEDFTFNQLGRIGNREAAQAAAIALLADIVDTTGGSDLKSE